MFSPMVWFALLLCLIGNVASSLGFRQLSQHASLDLTWQNALELSLNPYAWMGLVGGLTFIAGYLILLRTVAISVAYPLVVSLGIVGVVLAGILILGEQLKPISAVGLLFIIGGVLMVSQSA